MNRNTALISAASVVAVVVAGVTAIGANIGILSSADGGPVGNLNAAGLIDNPIEPQVIDIYVDGATTTGSVIADLPPAVVGELIGSGKVAVSQEVAATQEGAVDQEVAVAEAGTVVIRSVAGTVKLIDTTVEPGWSVGEPQSIVGGVQVSFTSASKSLIFVASVDDTGKLSMRVDEPIVEVVTVPAAPLAPEVSTQAHDDDYEDDDHEDDDYEDDDHEDDDHEDDDYEDDDYEDDDHEDDDHEGRDDDD